MDVYWTNQVYKYQQNIMQFHWTNETCCLTNISNKWKSSGITTLSCIFKNNTIIVLFDSMNCFLWSSFSVIVFGITEDPLNVYYFLVLQFDKVFSNHLFGNALNYIHRTHKNIVLLSLDMDRFSIAPKSRKEWMVDPNVKMVSTRFLFSSFNISSYNFFTLVTL